MAGSHGSSTGRTPSDMPISGGERRQGRKKGAVGAVRNRSAGRRPSDASCSERGQITTRVTGDIKHRACSQEPARVAGYGRAETPGEGGVGFEARPAGERVVSDLSAREKMGVRFANSGRMRVGKAVNQPDPGGWVNRYLTEAAPIPGWFKDEDARLFAIVDRLQTAAGLKGDLLEVGGYLAKSAIALGYMVQQGETLVVIDPWDGEIPGVENAAEQERSYRGINLSSSKFNFQKFHSRLPEMCQGTSTQCLPELETARYRFIHIDGSHEWGQVKDDVEQVLRLLTPDGVVAFDDLFSRHTPGVGAAVWRACLDGSLVPFATTIKLYATRSSNAVVSARTVGDAIGDDPGLEIAVEHAILGSTVLEVRPRVFLTPKVSRFLPPALVEAALRSKLVARSRKIASSWR